MTDTEFYNGFMFRLFGYNRSRLTDRSDGNTHHFLARMEKGTARICTGIETLKLNEGDYFYIPYGIKYRSYWYPNENDELQFYSFGFRYFPSPIRYKLQRLDMTDRALEIFGELTKDMTVTPHSVGLVYACLGELCESMHTDSIERRDATLYRALEFMRRNIGYSAGDIAEHCCISESGLYSLFKTTLGETPARMRRKILAERAEELLYTTDMSVEEISDSLGFSSPSYFRKTMRSVTGKTPTEIRKNLKLI